jgi:putative ABC transport system permease protein
MSVQDRLKEYAVLQTIGFRPLATLRLVLMESTLLCFTGGILGTILAMSVLSFGGFALGAEGATIAFRPTIHLALSSLIVSIATGLLAGLAPAIQASTLKVVTALRDP